MKTLLLKKSDVESLLSMKDVITSVEAGYMAYCSGQVIQPDIVSIELPQYNGEMDIKSGYSESTRMISVKCASGFYDNQKNPGLPNSLSTVLLFDGSTGFPLCIMDGSLITGYRTGAAGAISAKLLARKDSKTIAVLGTGEQARMQILALKEVLDFDRILVFGRSAEQLAEYKKDMALMPGISVELCDTAEHAVRNADIVITTTPSKAPIVKKEWVRPGTHIIAVGADMEGKQELDAALFAGAKIVVDNRAQCTTRGETQNPLKLEIISQQEIHCEIGEILLGHKPGRMDDNEITIFDTTGMAVQDNVTAAAIYSRALERKLGDYYDFISKEVHL
jgi:alanine dehydrogenase